MMTMGIQPGKPVLVLERVGPQRERVSYGMATMLSMQAELTGRDGEPAIAAVYWHPQLKSTAFAPLLVHFTHADWTEGRAPMAYEELLGMVPGVCRYCGCTERRACSGGCWWADANRTVCSGCMDQWLAEEEPSQQRVGQTEW